MCGVVRNRIATKRLRGDVQGTRVLKHTPGCCLVTAVQRFQVFFWSAFRHISHMSAPDEPHACGLLPRSGSSPGAVRNAMLGNRRRPVTTVRTHYVQGTREKHSSIERKRLPVCRLAIWHETYTTCEYVFGTAGRLPPSDQGITLFTGMC